MNNFRRPEAAPSRPHGLLRRALIPVLLAAPATAAGPALLRLTPATAAAQSDPSAPDLLWMNGGHAGGSGRAALSPDGQVFAAADYAEVYLRRYSDGSHVRDFAATRDVRSIAPSADGRVLAAAIRDGDPTVTTFDVLSPPPTEGDRRADAASLR